MATAARRGRLGWQSLLAEKGGSLRADWLISLLLTLGALAARLPNLMLTPRYVDEGLEAMWALAIVRGEHLPLTGFDGYLGPLLHYLIAGLFAVLGVSPVWPRLLVAVVGSLVVGLVYWTARLMWNRVAGVVAAGLTLTNPILVSQISHNGWSDSLTPFFANLTLLAVYLGVTRRSAMALALSGLLAGLALQTHPTSGTLLFGMAAWFAQRPERRYWLRHPAPYLALGLFSLAYAPMLVANLRPDSPLLQDAQARTYAFAPTLAPAEYVGRLLQFLKTFLYVIGGMVPPETLSMRLMEGIIALLFLGGLTVLWRQGLRLIPSVMLSTGLLLPIVVVGFAARYFSSTVPLAYVAVGVAVAALVQALTPSAAAARFPLAPTSRRLGLGVTLSGAALLVIFPLFSLGSYYRYLAANGLTNAEYARLRATLQESGACGERLVLLDPALAASDPGAFDSRFEMSAIGYYLTLTGCPYTRAGPATIETAMRTSDGPRWLVFPARMSIAPARPPSAHVVTTLAIPNRAYTLDPFVLVYVPGGG